MGKEGDKKRPTPYFGEKKKRFIFFPLREETEVRETHFFTTHINLQLVLTLLGTGVKNAGSTRLKVFTPARMSTMLEDGTVFPEKCKTRVCCEPSFQQPSLPLHSGGCLNYAASQHLDWASSPSK